MLQTAVSPANSVRSDRRERIFSLMVWAGIYVVTRLSLEYTLLAQAVVDLSFEDPTRLDLRDPHLFAADEFSHELEHR